MDTDNSGTITYEELKTGLTQLGSKLTEGEVQQLMEAVSSIHSDKNDLPSHPIQTIKITRIVINNILKIGF